jgi:ADP-heptose:LPS heptosyltransferase
LERTPCHIILFADPGIGKELANGIMDCLREDGADMKRISSIAGKWTIRQSLAYAQVADVICGPETGPLNAVAMENVPKVIYLSHSSADNLTKHWKNTITLEPDHAVAKCAPCHRLHHTWQYCFKDEKTGAAVCASSIKPERVFKAIAEALGATPTRSEP